MDRARTTKFLSDVLVQSRLTGQGKYYAREVSIDWGTDKVRRVDFLQFCPENVVSTCGIERGKFICYEVKSCVEDVFSGNGLNFIGEQNYIVMTKGTWGKLLPKYKSGDLARHVMRTNTESSMYFGIMVAVPNKKCLEDDFEEPNEADNAKDWHIEVLVPCRNGPRNRAMVQLLFYMLRAGI